MTRKNFKQELQDEVFPIIAKSAADIGIDCYVIGGFVRDLMLHKKIPKDIDIVAVGSGIALAKKVAEAIPGKPKISVFKNFGTAMIRHKALELEFVGARTESYQADSRKPFVENGSLFEDQERRDFTINTMAISLNQENYGDLIDPFDGIKDLKQKLLKTPLEPNITYSDDPLRMMRAIRFATQLGFTIQDESLLAISSNRDRIKIVSKERIIDEFNKILLSPVPSVGIVLLHETGLLPLLFPELKALQGIEEIEGQRHKDNFWHTLEVVDNISKATDNLWLRWAALLHDIGKAPTKKFDKKVGWTFHGHEFVGSKMVYKLFRRLHLPLNEKMKFVQKMVRMSSRPIILAEDHITDSAIRRLVFDAGNHVEDLMTLCEADITTKNPRKQQRYKNNFKRVRNKIVEVEARDSLRNFQPPVSGEEIMKTFNLKPSREIGIIKEAIKEAILEGEIPNDHDKAFEYMLKKGEKLGLKVNPKR
ncbi:CCA tRNA nucleotidyltransferase [Eudoraea chungangensis]|uniref:CCA tRNA nucleotidyltransferase n=1 Tax=Eudoraea chungangensis TaxID=1481905 RepID=UPI0023ECF199|nr:HD domain-containing protein [Eudoraea chungangensis]